MMISKALVTLLAVSAMAMAVLQNVEGGRDMAMVKEAKARNPQMFNENLGYNYKPKEEYGCDGYKYKDGDCYKYGYCDKSRKECDCDGYKAGDCDEYGNCDKSPYREDDDHQYNWNSYKKQAPESKKDVAGKYGVHPKYPSSIATLRSSSSSKCTANFHLKIRFSYLQENFHQFPSKSSTNKII